MMGHKRILLFRTEQTHYQLISSALTHHGFSSLSYDFIERRIDAFEQCRKFVPRMMFAGWKGEDDTIQLARNIRDDLRSPDRTMPIIFLTTLCKYDDVFRAVSVNVTDYIILPLDPEAFSERLSATFARCGLIEQDERALRPALDQTKKSEQNIAEENRLQ